MSEFDDQMERGTSSPGALQPTVLGALWWGMRRAWRSKSVIFWLWLINLSSGFTATWWIDFSFSE